MLYVVCASRPDGALLRMRCGGDVQWRHQIRGRHAPLSERCARSGEPGKNRGQEGLWRYGRTCHWFVWRGRSRWSRGRPGCRPGHCLALSDAGAAVAVCARSEDEVTGVADEIEGREGTRSIHGAMSPTARRSRAWSPRSRTRSDRWICWSTTRVNSAIPFLDPAQARARDTAPRDDVRLKPLRTQRAQSSAHNPSSRPAGGPRPLPGGA
jgi:hypothetical protein